MLRKIDAAILCADMVCCFTQAKDAAETKALIDEAKATPKGQKKDISRDMFKGYCPPAVEAAWYVLQHQPCKFLWQPLDVYSLWDTPDLRTLTEPFCLSHPIFSFSPFG